MFIFTVKHLILLQKACTKCGIDKEVVKWYNKKALSKRGQASEEEKLKKLQEKHLTNEELYDRMIKLLKRNRMRISRKTENSDEINQKVLKKSAWQTSELVI